MDGEAVNPPFMALVVVALACFQIERPDYRISACDKDRILMYDHDLDGLLCGQEGLGDLVCLQVDHPDHFIPRCGVHYIHRQADSNGRNRVCKFINIFTDSCRDIPGPNRTVIRGTEDPVTISGNYSVDPIRMAKKWVD